MINVQPYVDLIKVMYDVATENNVDEWNALLGRRPNEAKDDIKNLMGYLQLKLFQDHEYTMKLKEELCKQIPMACPAEGEFIGYKKCVMISDYSKFCIVKLLIPEDAKRSSAFGNKCRCSKAKVIDIYALCSNRHLKKAISCQNPDFMYEVGQVVEPNSYFDTNRFHECGSGIHFFMTEEEARNYKPYMYFYNAKITYTTA